MPYSRVAETEVDVDTGDLAYMRESLAADIRQFDREKTAAEWFHKEYGCEPDEITSHQRRAEWEDASWAWEHLAEAADVYVAQLEALLAIVSKYADQEE